MSRASASARIQFLSIISIANLSVINNKDLMLKSKECKSARFFCNLPKSASQSN